MIRILEIPMLSLIIGICCIHANRFHQNIPIGKWFHLLWACVYAVPAAFFAWQMQSWWLLITFAVERFVFYNPVLNIIRFGWNRDKFFYLGASKNGSWWDLVELWWKEFYPFIWALGGLFFIICQFYL